jgi:hypothetical protein
MPTDGFGIAVGLATLSSGFFGNVSPADGMLIRFALLGQVCAERAYRSPALHGRETGTTEANQMEGLQDRRRRPFGSARFTRGRRDGECRGGDGGITAAMTQMACTSFRGIWTPAK